MFLPRTESKPQFLPDRGPWSAESANFCQVGLIDIAEVESGLGLCHGPPLGCDLTPFPLSSVFLVISDPDGLEVAVCVAWAREGAKFCQVGPIEVAELESGAVLWHESWLAHASATSVEVVITRPT